MKALDVYAGVARANCHCWLDLQHKQSAKHQTAVISCEIECFPKLFTFIGYDFLFKVYKNIFPFLIVLNYYEIERKLVDI